MLASGPGGPEQAVAIWSMSVVGGELRKLRDGAQLATPAPDGSLVAFIGPDYNEIWVMKGSGEEARKVLAADRGATFLQLSWEPDGQRLAYLMYNALEDKRVIESCDLKGGNKNLIWADVRIQNFCWTPRGRVIATLRDPDAGGGPGHSDLWQVEVRKDRPSAAPKRLTNFAGFTPLALSITADEKHLALIRSYDQSDVYVSELEDKGSRLGAPRRLTLDDRIDWPGGWTHDSKSIYFYSDRQGPMDLFKQRVEDRAPAMLVSGAEEKREPQLSPDGSSILYLLWTKTAGSAAGKVMRAPVSGGPPQFVSDVRGYPGSAEVPREIGGIRVLTAGGYPDLRCPLVAGKPCVLSEGDSTKVTFYLFDPQAGKKGEIATVPVQGFSFWDLSPDGAQIALGELARNDRIRILPVSGGAPRDVAIKAFRLIDSVGWSADGISFFLTGTAPEGGSTIRHVWPDGKSQLLFKADAWLERPMVSPDGRYLAFGEATSSNNVWSIENF